MYKSYFNIADIIIEIQSPFPFITCNGEDFRVAKQNPDFVFCFQQCMNIMEVIEDTQIVANLYWAHEYRKKDGTYLRAFLWKEKYYPMVTVMGENKGICYYSSVDILRERAQEGFELWMYLCLERLLLQNDALTLHSSHICVDGKGLVFSAPSQTGKSTQASLWEQHVGAIIINGDRSVLRKKDGVWNAYGCPMCGSSGIHLQSSEPLFGIVMLSQGKENVIRRISGMEAFRKLYPEFTISKWERTYVDQGINLLNDILTSVPIWHYSCTKDEEAVTILKDKLGL